MAPPYKDVIDFIAMCFNWGAPTAAAIAEAEKHYGFNVVTKAETAVLWFLQLPLTEKQQVYRSLSVDQSFASKLGKLPTIDSSKNIFQYLAKHDSNVEQIIGALCAPYQLQS